MRKNWMIVLMLLLSPWTLAARPEPRPAAPPAGAWAVAKNEPRFVGQDVIDAYEQGNVDLARKSLSAFVREQLDAKPSQDALSRETKLGGLAAAANLMAIAFTYEAALRKQPIPADQIEQLKKLRSQIHQYTTAGNGVRNERTRRMAGYARQQEAQLIAQAVLALKASGQEEIIPKLHPVVEVADPRSTVPDATAATQFVGQGLPCRRCAKANARGRASPALRTVSVANIVTASGTSTKPSNRFQKSDIRAVVYLAIHSSALSDAMRDALKKVYRETLAAETQNKISTLISEPRGKSDATAEQMLNMILNTSAIAFADANATQDVRALAFRVVCTIGELSKSPSMDFRTFQVLMSSAAPTSALSQDARTQRVRATLHAALSSIRVVLVRSEQAKISTQAQLIRGLASDAENLTVLLRLRVISDETRDNDEVLAPLKHLCRVASSQTKDAGYRSAINDLRRIIRLFEAQLPAIRKKLSLRREAQDLLESVFRALGEGRKKDAASMFTPRALRALNEAASWLDAISGISGTQSLRIKNIITIVDRNRNQYEMVVKLEVVRNQGVAELVTRHLALTHIDGHFVLDSSE